MTEKNSHAHQNNEVDLDPNTGIGDMLLEAMGAEEREEQLQREVIANIEAFKAGEISGKEFSERSQSLDYSLGVTKQRLEETKSTINGDKPKKMRGILRLFK